MFSLLPLAALGFFLGIRHATDPDHVVAVATIVSRERTFGHAALIGILWGLGHTFTILLAGGVIAFFGLVVPPQVGLTMELSVAFMLIVLGALGVAGVRRQQSGPHAHGVAFYPVARPFVVGVVHGLAGSAAVALLVVATIDDPLLYLAYLFVFGLGTIAGMLSITLAIALPFMYSARRLLGLNRVLTMTAGLLSVGFGLFLIYEIGFARLT